MRENKAFSLIELIVVIAIVSILSSYVGVSFVSFGSKQLEAQTMKLGNDLCWIREMAVSGHRNFIVDFDTANKSYSIYRDTFNPANLIEKKNLDIDTISIIPSPTRLQFTCPKGTLTPNQQKIITLIYKGRSSTITLYPLTGYIAW